MIHERFRNGSRIIPPLAYARGSGSRDWSREQVAGMLVQFSTRIIQSVVRALAMRGPLRGEVMGDE